MPFAKPSDVPDNVPAAHKAQFMEVFNSAWKAAKDDKKSDAQADETSFAQAWGVITKAGAKPKRDVSSDGPGFGPVEKKDGGQAADPTQSLRALEEEVAAAFKRFSEDQARDSSGKWTAGSTYEEKLNHVSRLSNSQLKKEDEKLRKKSSEYTDKMIAAGRGDERPSDYVKKDDPLSKEGKELLDKHSAITHETHVRLGPGSFPQHLGAGGPRIKDRSLYEQTEERFAADQPRDPDGKFAAGSTGEDAHDTEGHLKAAADHTTLAKQEMAKGDKEHMKLHEAAAHAHLTAAFAHKETMAPLSAIAQTSSHTANTFPDEKVGRSLRYSEDQPRDSDGKFGSGSGVLSKEEYDKQFSASYSKTMDDLNAKKESGVSNDPKAGGNDRVQAYHDIMQPKADELTADNAKKAGALSAWSAHRGAINKYRDLSQIPEIRETTREKYMSIERRYCTELRVGESQGDEMALVGYAARFNQESRDLGGFRETIAPGAFTRAIDSKADVLCLFNHGTKSDVVLGRTTSGTLTMAQDENGLKFRCQLDQNQQSHRDLHASIKRGDISECSFAFTPNGENGDHWEDRKDAAGNWYISRTLKDVNLFDVSAVSHPAYYGTNVNARNAEAVTPEIRSIVSAMVEKRAKKSVETREDSLEEYCTEVCKALCEKFPGDTDSVTGNYCGPFGGKYLICETYTDCVIASECGSGEYVRIPYVEDGSDNYVFGTPVPVEKEWVPSDRAKSIQAETRAFKASHMQQIADQHAAESAAHKDIADQHTAEAASHTDTADAHTAAAASAQEEADRMEKCSATSGDCSLKSCRCQNVMVAARDMDDDWDDDWDENDHTDEENAAHFAGKDERKAARKSVEVRAAGDAQVRTKTVDGKALSAGAFAFVGDAEDTSTWKYPVHDKAHADNALARWGQHKGIPSDKEAGVYAKIVAAAKKFGTDVAETDATKAARSVSDKMAADEAAKRAAMKAARPMTREEIQDLELRFKAAMLSTEVELRYSEDQPRDKDGKFGSGGSGANPNTTGKAVSKASADYQKSYQKLLDAHAAAKDNPSASTGKALTAASNNAQEKYAELLVAHGAHQGAMGTSNPISTPHPLVSMLGAKRNLSNADTEQRGGPGSGPRPGGSGANPNTTGKAVSKASADYQKSYQKLLDAHAAAKDNPSASTGKALTAASNNAQEKYAELLVAHGAHQGAMGTSNPISTPHPLVSMLGAKRNLSNADTEQRGGPGSGPRPGEGAKTQEEHDAAAASHIAAAEHTTGNAKEAHNAAAKAHILASASAAKADSEDAIKHATAVEAIRRPDQLNAVTDFC